MRLNDGFSIVDIYLLHDRDGFTKRELCADCNSVARTSLRT